jgi:hypothetical protein
MIMRPLLIAAPVLLGLSGCAQDLSSLTTGLVKDQATSCFEASVSNSVAGFSNTTTVHWVRSGAAGASQGSDGNGGCAIAHGGNAGTQAASGVAAVAAVNPVAASGVIPK